jgi:hypothetical protein
LLVSSVKLVIAPIFYVILKKAGKHKAACL